MRKEGVQSGKSRVKMLLLPLLNFFLFTLIACSNNSELKPITPQDLSSRASRVTLNQSLDIISSSTAQNYTVNGKCDSSLGTEVKITVGQPNVQIKVECQSNDTFSGEIDARIVTSKPAIITATQDNPSGAPSHTHSDRITQKNNIQPLALQQLISLNPPSPETHRIRGTCDSNFGSLQVKVEDSALNLNIDETSACNSNTFTKDLNIGVSTFGDIVIQLAQGPRIAKFTYKLTSPPPPPPSLSFNLPGVLNSATALSYRVTGVCDSSIDGDVTITVIEIGTDTTTPCNDNSFLKDLNINNVTSDSHSFITLKAEHGSSTARSTVTNDIISLAIDSNIEPLTDSNKSDYRISGKCDPSLTESLRVLIGQPDIEAVSTTCTSDNAFTVSLNASNVRSNPATITVIHGEGNPTITHLILNNINHFITLWQFPDDNYEFTIPLKDDSNLNYDFLVDWGDGETSEVTSFDDASKSHIYTDAGDYTITITGVCEGFQNAEDDGSGGTYSNQLIKVLNLGHMEWKDLSYAFANNSSLTEVLGGNTSQVVNMDYMFYGGREVRPDTSGWNTSQVISMERMFGYATNAEPDTSGWNTSQVTNMSYMFRSAIKANSNTSGWDTSQVTNMEGIFYYARASNSDTSEWNTSQVTNMSYMFGYASNIEPDTSGWDTSKVTNMSYMFRNTDNANPNTSEWNTSQVTNMSYMFSNTPIAEPDTSGWDTSQVTNMSRMFTITRNANPNTSGWDTSQVTDMSYMFYLARNAGIDTSQWDTSQVTNMSYMFSYASNANPDTSRWDMSRVNNFSSIFNRSGLSISNYSKFLIQLNEVVSDANYTATPSPKSINVGTVQYNSTAVDARSNLITLSWSVSDGGLEGSQ